MSSLTFYIGAIFLDLCIAAIFRFCEGFCIGAFFLHGEQQLYRFVIPSLFHPFIPTPCSPSSADTSTNSRHAAGKVLRPIVEKRCSVLSVPASNRQPLTTSS